MIFMVAFTWITQDQFGNTNKCKCEHLTPLSRKKKEKNEKTIHFMSEQSSNTTY